MSIFVVTLDSVPPSLNNAYREAVVDGHARRVLTGRARAWKREATLLIKNAAQRQGWRPQQKTLLEIHIIYRAPNILQWDLDGKPKLLLDAFCEAFGLDDRYVIHLDQRKERRPDPELVMYVTLLRSTQ